MSAARLATFGAGVLIAVLAWSDWMSGWWLAVPAVALLLLIQRHDRIIRARDHAARAATFYKWGLARIADDWRAFGVAGDRFRDDEHPYGNDLDLFGEGSLFQLLSIARTRAGEETLSRWLKSPASPANVHLRQDAVRELAPAIDLRETLALAGEGARTAIDPDVLIAWAEHPPRLRPPHLRWLMRLLTLITLTTGTFWALGGPAAPIVIALLAQSVVAMLTRARVEGALHSSDAPARELRILLQIVERLERERFASPRLSQLAAVFTTRGVHASTAIRRLTRLIEMHDWEHNLVFTPIAAVLMWGTHIAWALEVWRGEYGTHVAEWLAAAGEIEALLSLSAYSYEHPDDPFPDIIVDADPAHAQRPRALFDGTSLGHPLIPAARLVRNDVRLSGETRLIVVSGSNMSGKSTLLRTVGVNAVLALAGAPVRAASLRLSPLSIGATLRIQDSLQEGRSRFYAEISRIRVLAEGADGPIPLLFLLDELFHGTNSHDRLVGARGVLQSLLDRGAIGLVTTHDLALTAIARDLAPAVINTHFEDWFERGDIRFDYRMKPGPVTRSNALALMRAVGLDIPSAELP